MKINTKKSNLHKGDAFEKKAKIALEKELSIELTSKVSYVIGFDRKLKKEHVFDLGHLSKKILIECKSHTWTAGNNTPSAKLTVWNEAMLYFSLLPKNFKKIFIVKRSYNKIKKISLVDHYIKNYSHLIPRGVIIYELSGSNLIKKHG